jgi:hypothetical protein
VTVFGEQENLSNLLGIMRTKLRFIGLKLHLEPYNRPDVKCLLINKSRKLIELPRRVFGA